MNKKITRTQVITKVRGNKSNKNHKYVTIPKEVSEIKVGDYVRVIKEAVD